MGRKQHSKKPASRSVKRRRADGSKLPRWYRRLLKEKAAHGLSVHPEDFDADISGGEQAASEKREKRKAQRLLSYCENDCGGSDPDCVCQLQRLQTRDNRKKTQQLMLDDESERSYNGSDAGYYYQLKDLREARKRQLADEQAEWLGMQSYEDDEERKARRNYYKQKKLLKRAKKSHNSRRLLNALGESAFVLHSTTWLNHLREHFAFAEWLFETKTLDLRLRQTLDGLLASFRLHGSIRISDRHSWRIRSFSGEKRTGTKSRLLRVESKTAGLDGVVRAKFLSDDVIKLTIPRDLLLYELHQGKYPSNTADQFEFYGIRQVEFPELESPGDTRLMEPGPEMDHAGGWWPQSNKE